MDDFGFKFKIGDVLKLRHYVSPEPKAIHWGDKSEMRLHVLGRKLAEDESGVVRQYFCRAFNDHGGSCVDLIHYYEIELEPSEPFAGEGT